MIPGAGTAIRTTQVPRWYTFFFSSAGGVVCVHAFRICVRASEQHRPRTHECAHECQSVPVCACCPVSLTPAVVPGQQQQQQQLTPSCHWQQLLQCLEKARDGGWRGGCSSPLTLQQKSLTVTAVVAHSRLLIHKDTGGAFTTHKHTHIHAHILQLSCSSWHSVHTLVLRTRLGPVCLGRVFSQSRRKRAGWKMGGGQGAWGWNMHIHIRWRNVQSFIKPQKTETVLVSYSFRGEKWIEMHRKRERVLHLFMVYTLTRMCRDTYKDMRTKPWPPYENSLL